MKQAVFGPFTDGIQSDTLRFNGGFSFMSGVNIVDEVGVVRLNYKMALETEESAGNAVTTSIIEIVSYSGNAGYSAYGIDSGSGNRIYGRSTANKWGLVHDDSNTGYGGIVVFGSNMYWSSSGALGKYDGTTWTDSFKSGSSYTGFCPLEVFAGKLCRGAGRVIDTLDGDGTTYTTAVLTLPLGEVIRDMRVWNQKLAIITGTKLYLWDGASSTYSEDIVLPSSNLYSLYNFQNHLFLFECGRGAVNAYSGQLLFAGGANDIIYEFNGASFDKIKTLPSNVGTAIYSLSSVGTEFKPHFTLWSPVSSGATDVNTIGAVTGQYVAWRDNAGTGYFVDSISTDKWSCWTTGPTYTAVSYVDTVHHDLDNPASLKVIKGIKIIPSSTIAGTSNANGTGHTITILTDPDKSGTYTQQKIVTVENQSYTHWLEEPIICNTISVRFALSWSNNLTQYCNIKNYVILYDELSPLFSKTAP